jgi:hypothetical protein
VGSLLPCSPSPRNTTPTIHIDADVTGVQLRNLVVTDACDGITYDNAD